MRVGVFGEDHQKVILDIVFMRTHPGERRHFGKKELIDTICIILRIGGVAQGVATEIARGIAKQNPLDDYNKIIGRKVALTKAIGICRMLSSPHRLEHIRRRGMRKHIWEVFYKTFGRWN